MLEKHIPVQCNAHNYFYAQLVQLITTKAITDIWAELTSAAENTSFDSQIFMGETQTDVRTHAECW